MGTPDGSPLGKATVYTDRYDPGLLYAVERAPQRARLGLAPGADARLPFEGLDAWTAWEAQWLDNDGRPQAAVVRFSVPAASPAIVESKSVKLYFTALDDTRFASAEAFRATVARDLCGATASDVRVDLIDPRDAAALARCAPAGTSLDALPLAQAHAAPDASQLRLAQGHADETLVTERFRSVCPVTGQPDYASVAIAYRGRAIDAAALRAYLVAFRHHPGFHETCVERIFVDIERACAPRALAVSARFTRRGGIDINPWRRRGDVAILERPTLVQ
jgi:7-cyano-7-deazaguanine reductase